MEVHMIFARYKACLLSVVLGLATVTGLSARDANPVLVSTDWLRTQLGNPELVILQVDSKDAYEAGHIPGARIISLRDLLVEKPEQGLSHELPTETKLDSVFGHYGIDENSLIVISYGNEGMIPLAARIMVTLDYLGFGGNTHLLDGGSLKWQEEDLPMSMEVPEAHAGNLSRHTTGDVIVDADWVHRHLSDPAVALVDARPPKVYSGRAKGGHGPRKGHIAGAVNIPFDKVTAKGAQHRFKDDQELDKLFSEAGLKPGSTVVAYCGTGIWASSIYAAAKQLGYPVKFYDGSFQEWSSNPDLPVTAPVKRGWFR
jgi:3-mercaptopyruvate sulfurtransferase SseA